MLRSDDGSSLRNMYFAYCTSELVEVVLSTLSVLATEGRGDFVPLWAHLPLIIATPVTTPILVATLDVLAVLSPLAPLPPPLPPLPPPAHSSRTSPRTSDNLSGTLTSVCKTNGRVRRSREPAAGPRELAGLPSGRCCCCCCRLMLATRAAMHSVRVDLRQEIGGKSSNRFQREIYPSRPFVLYTRN